MFETITAYYVRLPALIKFIVLFAPAAYAYHFYLYHISKLPWKQAGFLSFAVAPVLLAAGYYGLRFIFPENYALFAGNPYVIRTVERLWLPILNKSYYALLLIPVVVTAKALTTLFASDKLKHGPDLVPTKSARTDGIHVGNYASDVLPATAQAFSSTSSGPLVIPFNRLSRTCTIIGDQGCGKSRLMRKFADDISRTYPDIPMIIHDPKGEWLRTYYNPETDLIFSPYDQRTFGWDVWQDFKKRPDLRHAILSTAVESHYSGSAGDRFWCDSAVALLEELATADTIADARQKLRLKAIQNQENRTFLSILETAKIAFKDLALIQLSCTPAKKVYTIEDLQAHRGKIFLLNNPKISSLQHGALSTLLTAFLLNTLSLNDVPEGDLRCAAIVDEALTFHLPPQIENAIYSQCRSKGMAIVTSAQWLPKRQEGQRGSWAIQSGHIFCMRVTDLETRTAFSQRIGSLRFDDVQHSTNYSINNRSTTTSHVERNYAALPPECFGSLKDREFILFHADGVAPGITVDVPGGQNDTIPVSNYFDRTDLTAFMSEI